VAVDAEILISQACADGNAGGTFILSFGEVELQGTVKDTGEWKKVKSFPLGRVSLSAGKHIVTLRPVSIPKDALMDFDNITLKGIGLRTATRKDYKMSAPFERAPVSVEDRGVPNNTLSPEERADGFQLLFDGETLSGWTGYRKASAPTSWSVIDGLLHFAGKGEGGDLMSLSQYANFELRLEWRVTAKGNSGVMYHVSEDKYFPFENAIEMQILASDHSDGKSVLTSAGACYGLYPTDLDAHRPTGEWNEARIIVQGSKHQFFLNGRKTAEFDVSSDEWHDKVKASKFHRWPGFARNTTGHIVLQDHGDPVWFRHIRIKSAP